MPLSVTVPYQHRNHTGLWLVIQPDGWAIAPTCGITALERPWAVLPNDPWAAAHYYGWDAHTAFEGGR